MLNDFWKQFKSGTDIRGVAVEAEGYEVNLTDKAVTAMVNGFILWLSEKTGKSVSELKISVGRDSRISGEHILGLAAAAMVQAGAEVLDCDLATTPAMFMTTVELGCDGALQVTASHHPYYRNGLKFFTRDGGLDDQDIIAVLEHAQNSDTPEKSRFGKRVDCDFMSRYAFILREKIKADVNDQGDYDHPLKGFKIVVDAGNGAGGFFATDVLEALGANVNGSQFLEPDGMFPNHIPNPENEEAMASVCAAVKAAGADLGVIFDTDVDRGGAVDADGKEINRNRLVAMAAAIALEGNKGGTVVTDSITSDGLKTFIEKELGGKHLRFKRGYKNVINEALAQNAKGVNCPLAIETSGHAAMRENYFLDDGAYLVTKIIIKMAQLRAEGKKLGALVEKLAEPVETKEIRIKITEKDFREYGEKVIKALGAYAEEQKTFIVADDNHEGIRVSFNKTNGNGWFLLRLSVHDPIMPLNIESDSKGGVEKIYSKLLPFLEGCEGLDTFKKGAKVTVPVEVKKAAKAEPKKAAPAKVEEKPAAKAEPKKAAPAKVEEKPAAKAEPKKAAPAKVEEKPAAKAEPKKAAPAKVEEKPAAKAEPKKAAPAKVEEKPAAKAEPKKAAPAKVEEKPAAKAEPKKAAPAKVEEKPAAKAVPQKAAPAKVEEKPAAKAETKKSTAAKTTKKADK